MQQQQMQRDVYGDEQDYGQEQYMQQMQMQQSESNNALVSATSMTRHLIIDVTVLHARTCNGLSAST